MLQVDATVHAAEVARFTRFVVRGPAPRDCWLWVGAIADDGYGRFWLNRNGHKQVVRPHRYALALARHLRNELPHHLWRSWRTTSPTRNDQTDERTLPALKGQGSARYHGELNPNSYAATAAFGLVSLATETLHEGGIKPSEFAVDALAGTFAKVVEEAQRNLTERTFLQAHRNARECRFSGLRVCYRNAREGGVNWIQRAADRARGDGNAYDI